MSESYHTAMDGKRDVEGSAKRQVLTALIATVPTFTYGIQIGWLSPMSRHLKEAGVAPSDVSWLAAALPLAAICGIPFFSYSSDRFGRKCCIVAVSVLSCISWIIKLTTLSTPYLIAARAVAGVAAAGCFVVVPVYVKEIAEDSWRGALASLTMTVCKLGVIFVYAVGMVLPYAPNQIVYLCVAAVHALLFCFLPESPNYLLKTGREKRAATTLAWLRSLNRGDQVILDELQKLREEQKRFQEMPNVTITSIIRDRATFPALRVTLTLMALQTLSGCFALMNFAADVFRTADAAWSPDLLALLMGSLQLAGSFFTTVSIEKFGRKIPLACSSGVVSACMAILGTYLLSRAGPSWLPAAAVCVCLLAYGAGLAPVPFVVMAELFTFQMRARMAGVSMAFSFFCSSMTVLFYAPIATAFGPYVVFYIFAAVTLWGVIYTIIWVPETKGKSLQEIQAYWVKPEPTFV